MGDFRKVQMRAFIANTSIVVMEVKSELGETEKRTSEASEQSD